MREDYARVFTAEAVASKYDDVVYAEGTYSRHVHDRQRRWLRELAHTQFPTPPAHHDFACGTGRTLRALAGVVSAAYGYDSSAQMLARARDSGVEADLRLVEASGPLPEPARAAGPALVTVFRLLLNAPPATRDRAVAFAADLLPGPESGLLVVGNHGNRRSLRHVRRWRGSHAWFDELSHVDVAELLARHRFEVVGRRGFAVLPAGAYRRNGVRRMAAAIDSCALRTRIFDAVATDVVYVARRLPGRI
jgi:SAM-dependent methyltransferase